MAASDALERTGEKKKQRADCTPPPTYHRGRHRPTRRYRRPRAEPEETARSAHFAPRTAWEKGYHALAAQRARRALAAPQSHARRDVRRAAPDAP
eukprot:5172519-Lingulodinium_polyedra.AAC.1